MIKPIRLSLERTFEASHKIPNHKGHCKNLHGHSYRVSVSLHGLHDSKDGIFIDFGDLKDIIDRFDHSYLNDVFKFPSAENLSKYFALKFLRLKKSLIEVTVSVYETETSVATTTMINPKLDNQSKEEIEDIPKEIKRQIGSQVNDIAFTLDTHPNKIYDLLKYVKED